MNFVWFDAVHLNSDAFFWQVAIPVVFVIGMWLMQVFPGALCFVRC
jgi:hypothetical protein